MDWSWIVLWLYMYVVQACVMILSAMIMLAPEFGSSPWQKVNLKLGNNLFMFTFFLQEYRWALVFRSGACWLHSCWFLGAFLVCSPPGLQWRCKRVFISGLQVHHGVEGGPRNLFLDRPDGAQRDALYFDLPILLACLWGLRVLFALAKILLRPTGDRARVRRILK